MSCIKTFLNTPEQEIFVQLTKQYLLEVAKQYNLSSVQSSFKKQHIANIIVISENIFDESASILIKENETDILKLTELKYQFELQKLQLEEKKEAKELELRKFQLEKEFNFRELKITNARSPTHVNEHFDVTKYVRLVPPFNDQQVDSFSFISKDSDNE